MGTINEEVRGAIDECVLAVRPGVREAINDLSKRAASVSNAFAIAPTAAFMGLTDAFHLTIDGVVRSATTSLGSSERLAQALSVESAYLEGVLHGGAVSLTLRDAFPDGDWDEEEGVVEVLQRRFLFIEERLERCLLRWAETEKETPARPIPAATPVPATRPTPVAKSTPRAELKPPTKPKPSTKKPEPRKRRMPDPEPPTQLEPIRPSPPSASERKARLTLLLAFSGELGIRIKKVPRAPSSAWLDKLQAKLEEIAAKKGMPSLFHFGDDARGTEETMAFVLPQDPSADAERNLRVDQMVAKADRAGLKLGAIPDRPSQEWLSDLEEKLEKAMVLRRKERKERRERIAVQRKDRILMLETYAETLKVNLGRIPPFPTEDWLIRAERRIATAMLPEVEGYVDRGRAERLAKVLATASDASVELEVPPDPDDVWLGWAESRIDRATGSGAALAIGADPDEVLRGPVLLFEEGTVQEQRWPIGAEKFTIGRSRDNAVQIRHDGQLSRQHCAIESTDEGFTVRDLRSTQGTRLNDKPVRKPTLLTSGDVITIGVTHLVFRYE